MSNILSNRAVAKRDSNLDLLRIIATLFVIILHYNNIGIGRAFHYTDAMPIHYQILLLFETLSICAVNIFVMISGYFLCTATSVSIYKILRLYIDVVFFSVLQYFLLCFLGEKGLSRINLLKALVPLNWYVAVYSGLYLFSPFLNQILQNNNRKQFRFLLMVGFFVLSVWSSGTGFLSAVLGFSLDSLSPISIQGSGDGYTLVNFFLLYFLGAYCRKYGNNGNSSQKRIYSLLVYFGCVVVNTIYAYFSLGGAISYCNPLVIIQTVAIFVFFQNLSINSKVINSVASCSFGVYLLHKFFFRFCQIERYATGNPMLIPIHVTATAVLIYAVSALIYWIYRKTFTPVYSFIQRKLSFLTYDANGFSKKSHKV